MDLMLVAKTTYTPKATKNTTTPKKKRLKKKLKLGPQKSWLKQSALHTPAQPQEETKPIPSQPRLLGRVQVQAMVGHSYPTIWSWMCAGKFPRPRITGGKSMWLESDIIEWMNALPVRRLKGDAA
jgi:predicted DNA-binding transcriptional regulator AlpA